jgi:hypothetical protein
MNYFAHQLRREVRFSFESFAPELPPGTLEKHGWHRALPLAKAMFFRLTPIRRALLIVALAMLASVFVISGDTYQLAAASRLLAGTVNLLVLLGLELADRVSLKRDLEVAREIQAWLLPHSLPHIPRLDIAFHTPGQHRSRRLLRRPENGRRCPVCHRGCRRQGNSRSPSDGRIPQLPARAVRQHIRSSRASRGTESFLLWRQSRRQPLYNRRPGPLPGGERHTRVS